MRKGLFALALVLGATLVSASSALAVEGGYGGSGSGGGKGGIGGGGAGGGASCYQSIVPPTNGFSVSVNGAEGGNIYSRNVVLTINGGNARRMAVSNSATFEGAALETANNSKEWTLSEGEGSKTIYVRFYDECGISTMPVSVTVNYRANRPTTDDNDGNGNENGDTNDNGGQVLGERVTRIDDLIASLRYGQRSADVQELQNLLLAAGYMPRNWHSTTFYGVYTLAGVTRYVDAHNGDLSELVGRLKYGQTHPDVRRLTRQLVAAGYLPKNTRISSYYGVMLRAAVARYNAAQR